MFSLSPALRYVLGAFSVSVSTLSTAFAAYGTVEPGVSIGLTVVSATLGYLLAPGAVGGTQEGLVNPTITEPPDADVEELPR